MIEKIREILLTGVMMCGDRFEDFARERKKRIMRLKNLVATVKGFHKCFVNINYFTYDVYEMILYVYIKIKGHIIYVFY